MKKTGKIIRSLALVLCILCLLQAGAFAAGRREEADTEYLNMENKVRFHYEWYSARDSLYLMIRMTPWDGQVHSFRNVVFTLYRGNERVAVRETDIRGDYRRIDYFISFSGLTDGSYRLHTDLNVNGSDCWADSDDYGDMMNIDHRKSTLFSDIPGGAWYERAVAFVSLEGLMNGYGNGCFGPDDSLTRAQMAQLFYNWKGAPVVFVRDDYRDTCRNAWYAAAVSWATQKRLVNGYGNGCFGPEDAVTREQFITVLYRFSGRCREEGSLGDFRDGAQVSGYAADAMVWAVNHGIVQGDSAGRLNPGSPATRAEIAKMLMSCFA